MIYTSRVNDGICDCCDGSDEYLAKVRCADFCKAEKEQRAQLLERLEKIADADGLVWLHGRLFAQWLHHVFPLECPFPHGSAAVVQVEAGWEAPATAEGMQKTIEADACPADGPVPEKKLLEFQKAAVAASRQQQKASGADPSSSSKAPARIPWASCNASISFARAAFRSS